MANKLYYDLFSTMLASESIPLTLSTKTSFSSFDLELLSKESLMLALKLGMLEGIDNKGSENLRWKFLLNTGLLFTFMYKISKSSSIDGKEG